MISRSGFIGAVGLSLISDAAIATSQRAAQTVEPGNTVALSCKGVDMSRFQANLLLLLAAAMWGGGNVAQKTILEDLDPFSAVGLRALIGGLLVLPLMLCIREEPAGRGWWPSLFNVTGLFAVALTIQQVSYLESSVTNASFLVNTGAVMTPLIVWLMTRIRPSIPVILAGLMMLSGSLLMSGGMFASVSRGDAAAFLSAIFYAFWIVQLERHMRTFRRPIATTVAQFLAAALLALPIGAACGGFSLHGLYGAMPELGILGVFSTALAFGLMTVSQRFTTASHAAIIVGAESVFGAAAAFLLLGERPSSIALLGALLVLASIVTVALSRQQVQAVDLPSKA
jgi:drug/metabolite transporter (DMT)-like permease